VLLVIKDDETAQMVEEKLKGVFGVK